MDLFLGTRSSITPKYGTFFIIRRYYKWENYEIETTRDNAGTRRFQ